MNRKERRDKIYIQIIERVMHTIITLDTRSLYTLYLQLRYELFHRDDIEVVEDELNLDFDFWGDDNLV